MLWFRVVAGLVRFFGKLFFGLEYDGLENLPKNGGYVVVSNHRSYWDPFFIGAKVLPNRTVFMAKKELFRNRFIAGVVKYFGAFPVDRGAGDMGAIEYAVNAVKAGSVLVIFPEGTRGREKEMRRFKSGAAHIIAQVGADVLPVGIDFKGHLHLGGKVIVHIGKPFSSEELGLEEQSLGAVRRATKVLYQAVDQMLVLTDGD